MRPALAALALLCVAAQPAGSPYFKIQVVDEATGRGVPLVELRTTSEALYVTDNNGIVAFHEPGLEGRRVYLQVKSHGYEYWADGFGQRGVVLTPTPGGSAVVKVKRTNIAERLYRITGEGLFRDSILTGHPVPIRQPSLNGMVTGQDAGHAVPYRGKLYWFWGDTNALSSGLGNFASSGATSELPGKGGLDPDVGIDLTYFVDERGFSRPMCPDDVLPGPGPKWVFWHMTLPDASGRERLVALAERIGKDGPAARGLVVFNDDTERFELLARFGLDWPLRPGGRPFRVSVDGVPYYYFAILDPGSAFARVRADWSHVQDPRRWESFTCLKPGARWNEGSAELDRDSDGRLVYAWKPGTDAMGYEREQQLVVAGRMRGEEAFFRLEDVDTGKPVRSFGGSVQWNAYRSRWVMLAQQNVGEIWYAEADTPVGPWLYARRVVSHDRYTFYLPVQHPFFDAEGGRVVYFEATYTNLFSGNPEKTPRYDYNQILYRLRLDDPRLALPVPVYRLRDGSLALREGLEAKGAWNDAVEIPYFAVPPDRARDGFVAYAPRRDGAPLFYAAPPPQDALAPQQRLNGRWRVQWEGLEFGMQLRVDGDRIAGTVADGTITRGTLRGEAIELAVTAPDGSYLLSARLQAGGALSGRWSRVNDNASGVWAAAKEMRVESPALIPLEPAIGRVWRNPSGRLILDAGARAR
jgi:hypothetical protein